MKRILAVMTINPDYVEFAVPELKSILSVLPIPLKTLFQEELTIEPKYEHEITHQTLKHFPYVTLTVPNFQQHEKFFQRACKSAVMLSKFVLLLGHGQTYEKVKENRDQETLKEKSRNWNDSVACDFISRNRVLGRTDQIKRVNHIFGDLDVRGKVNIVNAEKRYTLIEDHKWYQFHHESPIDSTLKYIYFGLQLCTNKIGKAKFNNALQLSKRIYLGPTSADNDLAFMMCNQAKISSGSLIIDPFVGTGGLIIPPASRGAYVFGCDLDMRVLNGYSVGRINKKSPYYAADKKLEIYTPKINLSFEQYGFGWPNICRMDSTRLAFRKNQIFDAIITDPPYGLRAMSRSIASGVKNTDQFEESVIEEKVEKLKIGNEQVDAQNQKEQLEKVQSQISQEAEAHIQQNTSRQSKQLTEAQILKKKQRRKTQKQNKRLKKENQTEEEKQFKKDIIEKLNKERIGQWDKFDKAKVQCTERQKIFEGLISFARNCLKQNGRLVFLYPVYEDEEWKRVESLPEHKGFKVIDMSENKLSKGNSRILVTLEKQYSNKE